jgi:uncharacterized membrane protein
MAAMSMLPAAVRIGGRVQIVEFERVMNDAVKIFEAVGVLILIVGGIMALFGCIIELGRGRSPSRVFEDARAGLGRAILLGLEILVVADIIRTIVVSPTLSSALTLGLIVVVRIALSFAIDVEVDGVAPWRRAEMEETRQPHEEG